MMKEVASQSEENLPKVQVAIQAQYLKAISFTSLMAPLVFQELKESLKIDMNLEIQVKDIDKAEGSYEVTLVVKIDALKDKDPNNEKIFHIDMQYSGVLQIKYLPQDSSAAEQTKQILLIYCPNLLFPFARSIVADVTRDAGFQPLMMNPIDFAGLYIQQTKNDQSAIQAGSNTTVH